VKEEEGEEAPQNFESEGEHSSEHSLEPPLVHSLEPPSWVRSFVHSFEWASWAEVDLGSTFVEGTA